MRQWISAALQKPVEFCSRAGKGNLARRVNCNTFRAEKIRTGARPSIYRVRRSPSRQRCQDTIRDFAQAEAVRKSHRVPEESTASQLGWTLALKGDPSRRPHSPQPG